MTEQVTVPTVVHDTSSSQTLSIAEAAQVLGISKAVLYDRARTSGNVVPGLPILRISSALRIPKAKLLAYAAGDWDAS